ncbi:uncharacterized protein LOC129298755 [Prosopis cineraria]|uniref:uncharacterized protein LOC129298755 n=1 Tax=Prosopis cineraria TaxID=364024 RepID=UPI00240FAD6E|nr:uncharacterized protein LOC129298755 [Prosopis cineraria]
MAGPAYDFLVNPLGAVRKTFEKAIASGSDPSSLSKVHPNFEGLYNLTIILLYKHFEGLKFTPWKFVYDRVLQNIPVRFIASSVDLREFQTCKASDSTRDVWCRRWTRLGENDDCEISDDGRFRCLDPEISM